MKKVSTKKMISHFALSLGASTLLWYFSNFNFLICFLVFELALLFSNFTLGPGGAPKE